MCSQTFEPCCILNSVRRLKYMRYIAQIFHAAVLWWWVSRLRRFCLMESRQIAAIVFSSSLKPFIQPLLCVCVCVCVCVSRREAAIKLSECLSPLWGRGFLSAPLISGSPPFTITSSSVCLCVPVCPADFICLSTWGSRPSSRSNIMY